MTPDGSTQNKSAHRGPILQIHPDDNVGVAVRPIAIEEQVVLSGDTITLSQSLPLGAKLALRPIAPGEKVLKYGMPIGSATASIPRGAYVHSHNLRSDYLPNP